MRMTSIATVLITGLLSPSLFGNQAQGPTDRLIDQLQKQYPLTKLTADKTGVVTAGAVLELKKDGLVMAPSTSADVAGNSYKAGRITQGAAGKLNKATRVIKDWGILGTGSATAVPTIATRTFVTGEKLNVTNIEYRNGAVVFELYSADAYANTYYKTSLTFPAGKGAAPTAVEVLAATSEVFSVTPPDDSNAAPAPASDAAAPTAVSSNPQQPGKYADIAPPPPPPPTPELRLGLTVDEVVSQLGQPASTATAGDKQIYLFKDWKVTFVKGKVADIDVR
jgi:hypothetical protein